jgi:hypothetical protein
MSKGIDRNGTQTRSNPKLELQSPTPVLTGQPPLVIPPSDKHLVSLENKLQILRDYTIKVALGFSPGLFVWGNGGIGKSYTVVRQLDALEVNHQLLNSRISGFGLFCHLEKYPNHVTLV